MMRNADNDVLLYVSSIKNSEEYICYDFDHELQIPKEVQFAYTALVTAPYDRYSGWFDRGLENLILVEALSRNKIADLVHLERIIDRSDTNIFIHTNSTIFVAEHPNAISETIDMLIYKIDNWIPTRENLARVISTAAAIAKRPDINESHISWLMRMSYDKKVRDNLQHNSAVPEELRVALALGK